LIRVLQPIALALSGSTVNSTCSATPNGSIQMEAIGGTIAYEYSLNGGAYQSSPNFTVTEGTYTVSVRDANGCVATSQQIVSLTNDLTVSSRTDTTICFGGSVELTTTGNATSYSWSGNGLNNNNIASPIATPSGLGVSTYTLTATLGQCTVTETVNITTQSQVQVNAGNDVSIVYGETVQLNATVTGASTYTWTSSPVDNTLSSTSVPNPTATPLVTTTYTITATNASGCTASDQITVTVIPYCIRVRNAFTPNNDGLNDKWQVYDQYDCLENVVVTVFNRYGSKVFESKNYRNDWDGTYKNKPVPDGTYYGVIEFRLLDKRVIVKKTDITVIR
jgi:gliding motility-associated-like protein